MKYFNFIKKIQKYSILAAILPMLAIGSCLFLFSNLGKITLFPNYVNWDEENPIVSWDEYKKDDTSSTSITNCPAFKYHVVVTLKDGTELQRLDEQYGAQRPIELTLNPEDFINIENTYGKKNILGIINKKTDIIESKCVKNFPINNKILLLFPLL